MKNIQPNQLKPVFCLSTTNIKKPNKINIEISNHIKSHIEPPNKTLVKLNSRLTEQLEVDTGYANPIDIKKMFENIKLSEGVRLVDGGQISKDPKPDNRTYGNTAFRITKSHYNKM